jgi:hypothetical protein
MRPSSCTHRQRPLVSAVVTVILLLIMGSCLAACGEGEAVDPREELTRASTNMQVITGFHFVYEVHKAQGDSPAPGLEIARITGDVNAEGDMQASIDVTQGGIPLALKFVAVGDTHYIENPLSQKWESVPAAESPVGDLSLSTGTIRILDEITGAEYIGKEKKGGTQTYHITGTVAAAEVAAIAGAVSTSDPFPTDLWIGVENGLVYEVDIHGPATPDEDAKIWRSIILSDLDVHVDIKAPQ